jgi:large subunit ribosomal protein L18
MSIKSPGERKAFRKARSRNGVFGTAERPRLSVFRSLKHIYVQVIDDVAGHTLAASSTQELEKNGRIDTAREVGKSIAEKAKKAGKSSVVFDRGGLSYHGQIKSLAEGAREGGLKF